MLKSICVMLMFCLVTGSVVAQENGKSIGRYQLQVVDPRGGGGIQLFLLDTETGTVWIKTQNLSSYSRWKKLPSHELPPPFPETVN